MGRELVEARYWNTCGVAIAVVAVITKDIDWAAYIGATKPVGIRDDTIQWTRDWGAKLSEADARHFFPNMTLPYRS